MVDGSMEWKMMRDDIVFFNGNLLGEMEKNRNLLMTDNPMNGD